MITAHPDDEDGGMLAYESRGVGAQVTLLTLNRGEGGANVMSSDFWDALGLVRTEELLAADRYYGVDQYWTRVCDYGFSKTMEEALAKWGRERVLGDVVRVVRMVRPLVVTSVFVGGPSDGHGNHQVAGLMAKEVFEAAGDPNRFPEQIREGLLPLETTQVLRARPFLRAGTVEIPGQRSEFPSAITIRSSDYLICKSRARASDIRNRRTEAASIPRAGSISPTITGSHRTSLSPDHESSFFEGIDTSLIGIAELAAEQNRGFLLRA